MARRPAPGQLIGSGLIPEQFQKDYAGIEDAYQSKLGGLMRDERSLFADYGFQGGIDEGGKVNFQADPNANHGLYQQLLQNIGGQLGQAKNEVRGRGIGRAGLAKARENLIRFMMSGEKTGLLSNFNKNAANIFGQRGAAMTDRNRGFGDVEGRALDWWNQYGPDDPDGNLAEPSAAASLPSFATSGGDGYAQSQALAQQLAAMNPAAQYTTDPMYTQDTPTYMPSMSDPYGQPPPRRRPSSGGGGGTAMVL